MRSIIVPIGLLVVFCLALNGQADIRFENYSIEDGLPHSRTSNTLQDSRGWIWFGTEGGLSRFDGLEFKNYQLDGPSGNGATIIVNCLWEDGDSTLWCGTNSSGLVRYHHDLDRFTYYTTSDSCDHCISSNAVNSIASDSTGTLWLGTENGLNIFDPEANTFRWIQVGQGSSPDMEENDIRKVVIDPDSRLWIGSATGLNLCNMESGEISAIELHEHGEPLELGKFSVEEIYQDKNGNLLVGTYNNGLIIIDPVTYNSRVMLPDPDYQRSFRVRAIFEDHSGNLWLGTRGGIYIFDKQSHLINHLTHDLQDQSSLGNSSVTGIFKDNADNLWVTHRNGVSHTNLRKTVFTFYRARIDNSRYLNDPEVYSITQAKDGNIWIGTESGGVNILDRKTGHFTYMRHNENNINSLSNNGIKSILQDRNGDFWIGTFLGGLNYYRVKERKFIHFKNDPENLNSLTNNTVWALHEDQTGNIWIGTDEGLDSYDPESKIFKHYRDRANLKTVHTIFEDREGNLYFGSFLDGLTVMSPESKMTHFNQNVRSIHQDSHGNIWIGSEGNDGLTQIDQHGEVRKNYTIEDGLPSNQIFGILEDHKSRIWLSTGQGLSMFDPFNEEFKNYKTEDGILGGKFNYGAYCRSNSGELLFGGQNGLTSFNPDQLEENDRVPPVVITDFRIFNKQVPVGVPFDKNVILEKCIGATKEIVVSYDQAVLTFDFVALNYVNGSQNKYAHMLEGFETDWNYVGSTRSATYTNLDPGDYLLRVKGSNNDGVWNETSLRIVVTPPFARTLFFRIFFIMLLGLIVYLIILFFLRREKLKNQLVIERVKSKELHKIDMMKFQFFTNISHEIRTPISLIVSPLSRIMNASLSKDQILKDIEVVHRNAIRLGKLVDQLLDYRKLEAGKLKLELSRGNIVRFLETTLYMFKEMSNEKQVKLEFYSVLDQIQIYFDADKIEKVIFNLLSNSFKHTPKGGTIKVAVSLTYQMEQDLEDEQTSGSGEYVQIVVQDTGSGIPESRREKIFDRFYQGNSAANGIKTGSGIGLALSKELIKIHKGRISLKSQEGLGTELTILIPAIKKDPNKKEPIEDVVEMSNTDTQTEAELNAKREEQLLNFEAPIVLILEDNTELLDFIRSIFEEDYIVLTAEDGEAGLALARESIPDLIISDVMMPKMDGNKLCKKIKQDFRTSHIPVILLSALSSKQHEKEGILGGADEYITKPFDPSLLKIRVDQLLATRRLLREKFSRDTLLRTNENTTSSPDDKFLSKLVSIVEENIADPEFGTVRISREVGVSRTQLYRKMSALTEMTVKEFIRNIRLKKAAQLILQDQMNISEAAYSVGFLQVAYFRKCFKEMYGMTPTEYTKKNENKVI